MLNPNPISIIATAKVMIESAIMDMAKPIDTAIVAAIRV